MIVVVTPPCSAVRRESFSVDGFSLLDFLVFDSFASATEFRLEGLGALGAIGVRVEGERVSEIVGANLDPGDNVRGEFET